MPTTTTPMSTKERDGEEFSMQTGSRWSRIFLNAGRFLRFCPPFRVPVPHLGIALSFHPHLDYCIFNESHPPSSVQRLMFPPFFISCYFFLHSLTIVFLACEYNTKHLEVISTWDAKTACRSRCVVERPDLRQLQGYMKGY